MQVKTKITNPTNSTQQYKWVPKHGILLQSKGSVIMEGDLYTLNILSPEKIAEMKVDEEKGRVEIVLLTDGKVEKLAAEKEKASKVKPLPPPPPIPRNATNKGNDMFAADVNSKANILGDGIREGTIDEAKGKAWNPLTGEESDVVKAPTVSVSDALWKDGTTLENSVSTSDEKPIAVINDGTTPSIKIWSRAELNSLKIGRLRAIAKTMGMPEVESITRKDIIEWILETQGNA